MKKIKYLCLLILLSVGYSALSQTYVGVGNTLQRAPTAKGYFYRFSLGSPGFMLFYTQGQVDSLLGLGGTVKSITPGIGFTNHTPITSTGTVNVDTVNIVATKYYADNASPRIPGTQAISSVPAIGDSPGANLTASAWIVAEFYKTQPPTASLSGGGTYELRTSSVTHLLLWGAGRQAATATLATVVVNGISETFSQPAQGASTSGLQSVTTPANTNTTYTNLVTTTDGKTASATTSDVFLPSRYYGYSSSATPNNSIIVATSGGGSQLSNSKSGTFVITASGSNYPYFSYPSSEGALTTILDVNGFNVTSSFNQTTVSVTNAQGYVQNYFVYTLNAATSANYQITTN